MSLSLSLFCVLLVSRARVTRRTHGNLTTDETRYALPVSAKTYTETETTHNKQHNTTLHFIRVCARLLSRETTSARPGPTEAAPVKQEQAAATTHQPAANIFHALVVPYIHICKHITSLNKLLYYLCAQPDDDEPTKTTSVGID